MNKMIKWQPCATVENLFKRAEIISQIRKFFNDLGFLEVETPIISKNTVTDINLISFKTVFHKTGSTNGVPLFLMTSPEYHMKRLLAAGIGPIFQICHSFRNEELGRLHNPEFTMLEWYHPFYDLYQIMQEVDDLLQQILDCDSADRCSYQEIFNCYIGLDPLSADKDQLYIASIKFNLDSAISIDDDRDTLLQLLFTIKVEPNIGHEKPIFVYHFPASQALLAEISDEDKRVACRFEVYFQGIELANGYQELIDAHEQRQRFVQDNIKRKVMKLPQHTIDENFLAALEHGIPACSGVSLGIDRLLMLALKVDHLSDVMSFSIK